MKTRSSNLIVLLVFVISLVLSASNLYSVFAQNAPTDTPTETPTQTDTPQPNPIVPLTDTPLPEVTRTPKESSPTIEPPIKETIIPIPTESIPLSSTDKSNEENQAIPIPPIDEIVEYLYQDYLNNGIDISSWGKLIIDHVESKQEWLIISFYFFEGEGKIGIGKINGDIYKIISSYNPLFNEWLRSLPEDLITSEAKEFFFTINNDLSASATYYGHKLPWQGGVSHLVTTAVGGHSNSVEYYAYDFAMANGTEIWASKNGTVAMVTDIYGPGICDQNNANYGNRVVVNNDDGSASLYLHLQQNGARVSVGQPVKTGDLIGLSGNSGYVCPTGSGYHLHFQVQLQGTSWWTQSQRIIFDPNGEPVLNSTPVSGNYRDSPPPGSDAATFISQSTYPTVSPGQNFQIYFEVRNTGTSTWQPGSYWLQNIQYPMGANSQQALTQSVSPNGTYRWTINLTAPSTPGTYATQWWISHNGTTFGPNMFINVTVQSSSGGNIPSGYTYCALEREYCDFSGYADVAYGADGKFRYLYNQYEGVDCNNTTFGGDPIEGIRKTCSYKPVSSPGCPVVSGEVRLYDGTSCGSSYVSLNNVGLWSLVTTFNDRAESIAIPNGWSARVYKDDSETSTSKCYWATDTNMNNDVFNDSSTVGNAVTWVRVFSNPDCATPNNAPSTPTLSSPASGSSHTSTPQLCWNASTDQEGDSITYQVNVWGTTNYTSSWISGTCLMPTTLPVGNYTWNVRAKDSKGVESGASADRTFSIIPAASPDLIIQSITSSPQTPVINQQVTYTIRVKNQGNGNASEPFYVDLFIDDLPINNCNDGGIKHWAVGSLAAGATTDLTYTYSGYSTAGNHSVYAFADTNCYIAESNEGNNILGPIVINVSQGPMPDLIVESITYSPASPVPNQPITYTVKIKNQGDAAATTPFYVDLYADEVPITDCSDTGTVWWQVQSLGAGSTKELTDTIQGFSTSGPHNLYAFADTNCNVVESLENNNILGPQVLTVETAALSTSIPKPTLSAPVDNALITSNEVKLDWANASLPSSMVFDHYQVQVATDSGFANKLTDRTINDRTASETWLTSNLTPNTRYYWRVRVYNTLNQYSEWSLVRSFRKAMLPPALTAPAVGTTPNNLRPRFDWQDVSGATSYQIQISKYANMSSPSVSKTVYGSYYDPTSDLPVKRTLYWRVRAQGANGPSLWSEVRLFKTPNPPGRPSLQSPVDNALTRDYTPRLDWSTSSLPSGTVFSYYRLQVARDSGFINMALDTNISGQSNSEYTFTTNLTANTKYYWRVMAVNNQGQYRSWSSVRSFRTAILPPSLITPANNGTLNTQRPNFDWGDVSGASNYQIQISKYSSMKYPLIDVNVSASNYLANKNLPTGRNLYWRVRAKGSNGPSDWSVIRTMTIVIP